MKPLSLCFMGHIRLFLTLSSCLSRTCWLAQIGRETFLFMSYRNCVQRQCSRSLRRVSAAMVDATFTAPRPTRCWPAFAVRPGRKRSKEPLSLCYYHHCHSTVWEGFIVGWCGELWWLSDTACTPAFAGPITHCQSMQRARRAELRINFVRNLMYVGA